MLDEPRELSPMGIPLRRNRKEGRGNGTFIEILQWANSGHLLLASGRRLLTFLWAGMAGVSLAPSARAHPLPAPLWPPPTATLVCALAAPPETVLGDFLGYTRVIICHLTLSAMGGLVATSPKMICWSHDIQHFRIWLYLEIGLLQS